MISFLTSKKIMLIDEDTKAGEVNPDIIEGVFEEDVLVDEDVTVFIVDDEEVDEIDIAFAANDEGYW